MANVLIKKKKEFGHRDRHEQAGDQMKTFREKSGALASQRSPEAEGGKEGPSLELSEKA
jgi:hypothetical protein